MYGHEIMTMVLSSDNSRLLNDVNVIVPLICKKTKVYVCWGSYTCVRNSMEKGHQDNNYLWMMGFQFKDTSFLFYFFLFINEHILVLHLKIDKSDSTSQK